MFSRRPPLQVSAPGEDKCSPRFAGRRPPTRSGGPLWAWPDRSGPQRRRRLSGAPPGERKGGVRWNLTDRWARCSSTWRGSCTWWWPRWRRSAV